MVFKTLIFIFLIVCSKVNPSHQYDKGKNIALGKPTFQSNEVEQGVSSNAVDGNRHPDYSEKSCIQTKYQHQPWWMVDLQDDFYVTSVVITNRRDCCYEKLVGFEIRVGNSKSGGGVINAKCAPLLPRLLNPGEMIDIVCDEPLKGRYVSVIISTRFAVLNFCELEVYGRKASSVLRLMLMSNGMAEAGPSQNIPSQILDNDRTYFFPTNSPGIRFKLYDIKTGEPTESGYGYYFDTHGNKSSLTAMKNFLSAISPDMVVAMVLFYSGENYYQDSLPYLKELLGQPITADLEFGESWALLGYKGTLSPIPHWRESVRRKMDKGPSKIAKLITLRKAPSGSPTNVKIVLTNGTSIKLTWSRPSDFLTDHDYPLNYSLCIKDHVTRTCAHVNNEFEYTFTELQPVTSYLISVRAQSADMFGEAFNLTSSTIESDGVRINVKLLSRVEEDVLYRVYGQPQSSIIVAGALYNFDQYGHNFLILDAKTGFAIQQNSFNTYEDPDSGSKMAAFLTSLANKVIILMVVYHRAHVYYKDAVASLITVCPHAPTKLTQNESNALICLKGMGTAPWVKSTISSYSLGPAVLETDILLPKDVTYPTITSVLPSPTRVIVKWRVPDTDKFTGNVSKYELCYTGDFNISSCIEIDAAILQWTITGLHPHVQYELKIRAAALLGYGPFSGGKYVSTLETVPRGPPTNFRIIFVNSTSIHAAWLPPERILQNGIIQGYSVCVRSVKINAPCQKVILPAGQETYIASGLAPFAVYDVIVSAATSMGYGPSILVSGKTLEAVLSGPPKNIRVIIVSSASLTVTWSAPEEHVRNGVIQNYKVCIQNTKITDRCKDVILPGNQEKYTASDLAPFTVYDVIVSAATSVGYGPSMTVSNRTLEAAPSSSPLFFMVTSVNSTRLRLTWKEPTPEHHNGVLTKYRLTLLPEQWSLTSERTILLPKDHVSYIATNLRPYVNYVIKICAGTDVGFGPAAVLNVTTLMEAPSGPPTLVQIENVTATTFKVAWSPPAKDKRNGVIISYFLCIREFGVLFACNDTRIVSGFQSQQLFTKLDPDREYLVEIKAVTAVGSGPSAFVQKMAGKCDNALLNDRNKIENFQFSASGFLSDGHEAFQARFSNLQIWCEDGSKKDAFLQVDIGGLIRIIAVATQGDIKHFKAFVTLYNVLYSKNGASWTSATVSGKKNIQGNTGAETMKHYLDKPVLIRYIRFEVSSFSGPHQCMRVELYGCSPAVTPNSISILSSNATSLEVAWQPPKVSDANGDIQGYVICLKETFATCQRNKTYTDQNERASLIAGLNPYTEYQIDIACYNVAGEGSSVSVIHRTKQAAPSSGPESIEILATTTYSIRLYWTKVSEGQSNGVIIAYSLCYQEYELEHPCLSFQDIPSGSRNYILSNLQPFKEYVVLIRAATVVGWGPPASVRHWTLSAPPSSGPTTVFVKKLGPTVLEVTWLPPEMEKRNGIIVAYRLCAKAVSENGPCHNNIVVGGSERRLPIAGLKPYTWYAVSVEAGTTGGYGPEIVLHHRTGEWVPSGTPDEISVPSFNETSITVSWKSPNENEVNGILTSYKLSIYEQLDSGYLAMVSNKTVTSAVLLWTFGGLNVKTEYIIEVKAGTIMGFGPPSVVHQKTSGEADVTYVKKSNKAFVALAKAGIAAGALSFLAVIGFFLFISLLVTGYVPYTSPWRKRQRRLWREKVQKQKEERESNASDSEQSGFNSSNSNSSHESEFTDGGSDNTYSRRKKRSKRKKGKQKSSSKQSKAIYSSTKDTSWTTQDLNGDSYLESTDDLRGITVSLHSPLDPKPEDVYGQVLLNAYARSVMEIYAQNVEGVYGTQPENMYDTRPLENILQPENIYGVSAEDIYGRHVNTLSVHNYAGDVTSENLYGTHY